MSVIPSLSTVLSLLSFLTTVFVLARVGAAAFSANNSRHNPNSSPDSSETGAPRPTWVTYTKAATQPAAHLLQLQLAGGGGPASSGVPGPGTEMSFAQAVRFGLTIGGAGKDNKKTNNDREKGKMVEYIGGHDLVRMPATTWTGARRPGLLFRPREFLSFSSLIPRWLLGEGPARFVRVPASCRCRCDIEAGLR